MSVKEIICEGWLVKSPPLNRIWRGKWRRRWFTLYPGDFPQQYFLAYYTDRTCRKLKGTIDLSHCEQVDVGYKFDNKKLCNLPHIFAVKTEKRTYYLATETERELQNWTKCICDVCNLKPANEDEGVEAHSVIEEPHISSSAVHEYQNNFVHLDMKNPMESPPVSPASTGPYIPISECITGKSPVFTPIKNIFRDRLQSFGEPINASSINNLTYETGAAYHNFVPPPINYEIPRSLIPRSSKLLEEPHTTNRNNTSPLQSPADSDSVFVDDWPLNNTLPRSAFEKGPRTLKFSDSSADMDAFSAQRLRATSIDSGKPDVSPQVPPRPPKPAHIHHVSPNSNATATKNGNEEPKPYVPHDEMYDFPRSHNKIENDAEQCGTTRRHCYNNAQPGVCVDGQIFKYDGLAKQIESSYDTDNNEVPPSPSSQCSSVLYSNLPSPSLTEAQLMPPPVVNRGLKPKRKLSDTLSITSNPEPSSPRLAPNVDRNLKPPITLPVPDNGLYSNVGHRFKSPSVSSQTRTTPRRRAAPSPIPPILHRSFSDLSTKDYFKLEYLDLDLESLGVSVGNNNNNNSSPGHSPGIATDTIYRQIDLIRTVALAKLERERRELPV